MRGMLFVESALRGLLYINGQFCGPLEKEGQAFPIGRHGEIYIQLFPFGEGAAVLTAEMQIRDGVIRRLEPAENAFALIWPEGIVQLELRAQNAPMQEAPQEAHAVDNPLLRYLHMRLSGDSRAAMLMLRPQLDAELDLSAYHAAVPMRFAQHMPPNCDMCAGLVRRMADNVAVVDLASAATVPAGAGRRLIERIEISRSVPFQNR